MQLRKLGRTGLKVSPICLGALTLGSQVPESESINIIKSALDLGINFIDTADGYSGGKSEEIIGRWMKARGKRDQTLLITKVGWDMGEGNNISRDYIIEGVDKSLARLQTDYIDLYLTHIDDDKTEVEETLEAYDSLIKSGKVRWIGASNLSHERLKASLHASESKGLPKYHVFQPEVLHPP